MLKYLVSAEFLGLFTNVLRLEWELVWKMLIYQTVGSLNAIINHETVHWNEVCSVHLKFNEKLLSENCICSVL
jgi:hypothetical protein